MDIINWNNYNDSDFTYFCGVLLSMEIGNHYNIYTAPGRDGGIDGQFTGNYNGKNGNWRFQFKFHQQARKAAVSALKQDIKNEAGKVRDENYFIVLTNVELLPQESTELVKYFETLTAGIAKKVVFEIWDGAKVLSLYAKYPLLSYWLNEGFQTAQLIDYRQYFKDNLTKDNQDASTLSNYFISRKDSLEALHRFIEGEESMALVLGEAGIGKTRLVIEFFKELNTGKEEWHTLVLVNHAVDFDKITKALTGGKKYVVLLDDAHTFNPSVIADMKRISVNLGQAVKLILTARKLEAYESLKLVKEYEQEKMMKISLGELSKTDTHQLFTKAFENHFFHNYIADLTNLSHGKPILIQALIRAAKNNTPISKVRENGFLSSYVTNTFKGFSENISRETGTSLLKLSHLLQNIALIEPFDYNDSAIIEKIATSLNIDVDTVALCLAKLKEAGHVAGRYQQGIKPDYYSDILLTAADSSRITKQLSNFHEFMDNIIINLSSVDEVKKQPGSILDDILEDYTSKIDGNSNYKEISAILQTISSIAYLKPAIAVKAVNAILNILQLNDHPITGEFSDRKGYHYHSANSIPNLLQSIIYNLIYHKDQYPFVFESACRLFSLTNHEKAMTAIFQYSKRDVVDNFSVPFQSWLTGVLKEKSTTLPEKDLVFGIQCCKVFLTLDFTMTGSDGNINNIVITSYFIPANKTVKSLRKTIIGLLTIIYKTRKEAALQSMALAALLDIPRAIFATTRNPTPYPGDKEIEMILSFLVTIAEDLPLADQKEVIDKLYWFRKWGINKQLYGHLDKINDFLKPKDTTERLVRLFSKSENSFSRLDEKNMEKTAASIIQNEDPVKLADSIIIVSENYPDKLNLLSPLFSVLQRNFPGQSKIVYTTLWEKKPAIIHQFGPGFLGEFYFFHHQNEFYWEKIAQLTASDSPLSDNVILKVYSYYAHAKDTITEKDLDIIKTIAEKKVPANNFDLARALETVISVDETLGKNLSAAFLKRCTQRETDIFFMHLTMQDPAKYQIIKELLLAHTLRFDISYELEHSLNMVVKRDGIEPIFTYFTERYKIKKTIIDEKNWQLNYEWVPRGEHSHLFDGCEAGVKLAFFYQILDWFITRPLDYWENYTAKDFLEYGQPSNSLTPELVQHYTRLIDDNISDLTRLQNIIGSLAIFHHKEQYMAELVISTYKKAYALFGHEKETFKKITTQCFSALTTMGVKSGTGGQPFQVDIDLSELLKSQLPSLPTQSPEHKFISDIIGIVEKDIQSQYEREDESW